MKIAISALGSDLVAQVDPRFGRCRHFIIIDPDTMQFEIVENTGALASGGAGISAAQVIIDRGVEAVLTGSCGPNAYQVLEAAGVKVFTGTTGTIQDAIESYKAGGLAASTQPNVGAHSGTGRGMGRGRGAGRE